MPSISTKQFGIIQFDEEDVFDFPHGLPGFEQERRFLCVERPALRPVVFLQSLEHPDLCFITLPAQSVDPGYSLEVGPEERTLLGLAAAGNPVWEQSLACLAIVCLPADGAPTANLLGPVVLSRETRRGVQAVRDDCRYSAITPLQPAGPDTNSQAPLSVEKDRSDRLAEV
ncbi:MAG TPA: flagellar assembly protein FliW [Bryobacteraceae bacterium]|nr:flagellar assembly protein FliW [Bryobacteraceae bacterium]